MSPVIESEQPQPLIDLECSDFSGVTSLGTIAGVTARDPRGVVAESLDVVPLADIVRNAGGIACEFSDGGAWRVLDQSGGYPLNTAWRGAAIFVVPRVGSAATELVADSTCTAITGRTGLCIVDFVVGSSWVTVVSPTSNVEKTFQLVRAYVTDVVSAAALRDGPLERASGTFQPPRECASLVPTPTVATVLGGADVIVDTPYQLNVAAEATFFTENTGCQWYRESGDRAGDVHVYPGGAWAADLTLPTLTATEVELNGLREGDRAVSRCTDVSEFGFWICRVEVVVDGTWIRAIGSGPGELVSTEIAVALAEATLTHRE